jgi:hypothetical protein
MIYKFAAVASVVLLSGVASADLLINGSFESPDTKGGWGAYPNDKVGGWFAEQNTMEVGAASVYGVTGQTGHQVLELDSAGNSKISQNVNTTTGFYTLTLDAAIRKNVAASSGTFDILWNNVLVASISPTMTSMKSFTFNVKGTGGMDKLSLLGTGKSDSLGAIVDNVQLKTTAPVPEPASMAVLGLGVLGFLRKRKQK